MKNYNFNRKAQGFSLIELLLVLAIVAALAVAAFIIYPRVQASTSANSASQTLASASASVRSVFTSGNYANLNAAAAVNGKFFPDSYGAAAPLANEWGGLADINGSTRDGATATAGARYFTITLEDVPAEVCKRLAPAAAANFGRVAISGAADVVVVDSYADTEVLLNEAAVLTACGDTPVTMTFTTR